MLRKLLRSLHRLHVGTLDSFTVGIIRAFPMELGVSSDFDLTDDGSAVAAAMRREVFEALYSGRQAGEDARREFRDAYRQATFGQEEKGLAAALDTFLDQYRTFYRVLPWQEAWGPVDLIWPQGCEWTVKPSSVADACRLLDGMVAGQGWTEDACRRWAAFSKACSTYGPGTPWKEEIKYIFTRLAAQVDDLRTGSADIKLGHKPYTLDKDMCTVAFTLLHHIIHTEITSAIEKTRGIYRVLCQFEELYDRLCRQHGKLTFADAQALLTPANACGGAVLSRDNGDEQRLYIDYRLDCKLDHWLLDEFQDTSDLQWEALRNLADEVIQDDSGERSFFYVGDVKQAIYGWRGGNARLFHKILNQYQGLIQEAPLSTSFRSCQAVIDAVNASFKDLAAAGIPVAAAAEWAQVWQEHRCEEGKVPSTGYAAVLEPHCHGGEVKPEAEDRYRLVACLLKEIDPIGRGLSTAILARTNAQASAIVDYLRQECPHLSIVHEGRASMNDNPVVSLLMSLVHFAEHPGDSFAWRHINMSPLASYLAKERLDRHSLPLRLLRQLQGEGFGWTVDFWGRLLDQAHPLDDFGRLRLRQLSEAAREFDEGGGGTAADFIGSIDDHVLHELGSQSAVRVMSIHQSKGLGFDIVILPELQDSHSWSLAGSGNADFVVARDPLTDRPQWALKMPRQDIARADAALARQLDLARDIESFDALCLLYVALTRAKQGLYIVTSFPGKSASALTPAYFLRKQLAGDGRTTQGRAVQLAGQSFLCLFEKGQEEWFRGVIASEREAVHVGPHELTGYTERPSARVVLNPVRPSARTSGTQVAGVLFDAGRSYKRDVGIAVHALFQGVSWIEDTDIESLVEERLSGSGFGKEVRIEAIRQFQGSLASAEVREALSRPAHEGVELWRERPFEVVLGRDWVSGVFDRVMVYRDAGGGAVRAEVLDFKTDDVSGAADLKAAAKRYTHQMGLYRQALCRMLGLAPEKVGLRLVFTAAGRVMDEGI